jgi:hypothetical protein
MAAAVKGVQVVFGVPAGVNTEVLKFVTAGVVADYGIALGGATDTVSDGDNDIVTRIDSAAENKVTLSINAVATSVLPAKGLEVTGLLALDGVTFATGRTFVDDSKVDYANNAVKKISVSATHYPAMAADA